MDELFLIAIQFGKVICRRHDFVGVIRNNAFPNERFSGISREDSGAGLAFGKGSFRGVEAEVGFASVGIKTVTCEAVIRKQGTDVRVEPNWLGCCDCGEGDQDG